MAPTAYRVLADAVLVLHFAFVAFVVLGLVLILLGGARGWNWVRNRVFRAAHAAAIVIVVLQAWAGVLCLLTTLEMWLRSRAGQATYAGSFIAHWLGTALYHEAAPWVFTAVYTAFAASVLAAWLYVPPVLRR